MMTIADDHAEVYEVDKQTLGGYFVFEWVDIAKELESRGRCTQNASIEALSQRIFESIKNNVPADRVIVPCDQWERQLILEAAAQVGC